MTKEQLTAYRGVWKFEYSAADLLYGAEQQKEYRQGRVDFWESEKERVLNQIKESGISITEDLVEKMTTGSMSMYSNSIGIPTVAIDQSLQRELGDIVNKVREHKQALKGYEQWCSIFHENSDPNYMFSLTYDDYNYFFQTQ